MRSVSFQRARLAGARRLISACVVVVAALACAKGPERLRSSQDRFVELYCSRYNPRMQEVLLQAVVAGGGPNLANVAGWMCGRMPYGYGYVRIVMLEYPPKGDAAESGLVPVLFENEALIAFGWHLLERQPDRYAPGLLPSREEPWRSPEDWTCMCYGGLPEDEVKARVLDPTQELQARRAGGRSTARALHKRVPTEA